MCDLPMSYSLRDGITLQNATEAFSHELITRSIIGAFYEVYNTLGFGFFEQVLPESHGARAPRAGTPRRPGGLGPRLLQRDQRVAANAWICWSTTKSSSRTNRRSPFPPGLLLRFGLGPRIQRFIWTGRRPGQSDGSVRSRSQQCSSHR
jgi:hypothetical protein